MSFLIIMRCAYLDLFFSEYPFICDTHYSETQSEPINICTTTCNATHAEGDTIGTTESTPIVNLKFWITDIELWLFHPRDQRLITTTGTITDDDDKKLSMMLTINMSFVTLIRESLVFLEQSGFTQTNTDIHNQ